MRIWGGALAPSQHPLATLQLIRHPVSPLARAGPTWHRGPSRRLRPAGVSWRVFRGRPGRVQTLQPWFPSSFDAESARRRLLARFSYLEMLVPSGAFRVVGSRAGWSAARAGMVGQGRASVRAVWEGQEPAGGSRRAPKWPRAACHPRPYVRRHFACYPGSVWPSRACRRPKSC